MLKKLYIFTFLFIFCGWLGVQAQRPDIDSLENALEVAIEIGGPDTTQINLLNKLGKLYLRVNPEQAMNYSNQALELSQENNYQAGIAAAQNNLGTVRRIQGRYEDALDLHFSALKIDQSLENKNGQALALNNIGNVYLSQGNYEKALEYYFNSLRIKQEINDKNGIAISYNNIGLVYKNQGAYEKALENYQKSYEIFKEIGDKKGIANAYNNFGLIYVHRGNFEKAIENYLQSLKIADEIGDKVGQASILNNVGNIYFHQGNYTKALDSYEKSLRIKREIGDKSGIASSLSNIGGVYKEQGNYKMALENTMSALQIQEEIGDKKGIVSSLNNIGSYYRYQNNYDESLEYFLRSLQMQEDFGNNDILPITLSSIGEVYQLKGEYQKAIEYLLRAFKMARKTGAMDSATKYAYALAETYADMGNHEKSYDYHKLYSHLKDSMQSEQSARRLAELQTIYDTERKEQEIELLKKDKQLTATKQKNQRILLYFVVAVALLILIIAGTIYNRYRTNQKINRQLERKNRAINKQKEEIEVQKEVLEDKNRVITSSITYAKRIQDAILPRMEDIKETFPDSFILFKPREIVSGDFYWFTRKNGYIYLAAVDCTGHGVPGAFMSMIGNDLLNQIVNVRNVKHPNSILDNLHTEIQRALKQHEEYSETQDGMDIALCRLDSEKSELEFASANRILYLLKNDGELVEVQGDRSGIGGVIMAENRKFTNHKFKLEKGDKFYIFSDGIIDQFGGEREKKFGYKRLKETLLQNKELPLETQGQKLERSISTWIDGHEQIDDILVIGAGIN